jgi:signal transduction histidine kinase
VVGRDITERKRAEIQLEKLNRDLVEKNQEMENFLYITTHDLRSPLVNIQGFSQNLERYVQELREALAPAHLPAEAKAGLEKLTGDRIPGALKFVLESSRKMDALITALLKVSRLGRVEMKPAAVDMNALLKNIQASLAYQLKQAGGTINCAVLPPCKADPGAVSQLFTNLLDNAIKYRDESRALMVNVSGEVKDGSVFYTVADNGPGIPEADLQRIWNVFYQPERAHAKKGEGIGLPMVKRLTEKNGGSIKVESKEGQGSVFYLELPTAGGT